jgi:hypothetical protein
MRLQGLYVAASLGFEPRQRDSESLVLPLHHEAKAAKANAKFAKSEIRALPAITRINANQLMISNCFLFQAIRVVRGE